MNTLALAIFIEDNYIRTCKYTSIAKKYTTICSFIVISYKYTHVIIDDFR